MKTKLILGAWLLAGIPPAALATPTVTHQFLQGRLDLTADTITLPLRHGTLADGRQVWFLITDASDRAEATRLGVEYAPQLARTAASTAARPASWGGNGELTFAAGTVDFSPVHALTPGAAPNYFPPASFQPGSVGDAAYSPLAVVQTSTGQIVYNAPMLAFDTDALALGGCGAAVDYTRVHDHVVDLCPANGTVTIKLSHGFAGGQPLVYVSFDANNPMAATMEASTYAPALDAARATTATLAIYAVANGQVGADNPERQGFDSALHGDGSPLNVLDGTPSDTHGYSPLWDLHLGAWTDAAVAGGQQVLLTSSGAFLSAAQAGTLTGPNGGELGSTGILINCPVVALLGGE